MRANLSKVDLSDTNLRGANLYCANLSYADLHYANLYQADLRGADLNNAKNIPFIPYACPDTGSFIGYKKAGAYIVELKILSDARRCSATGRKCRCDRAEVLSIQHFDKNIPCDKKQWRVTMTVILSIELVKLLKNQTLMKIDGINVQKESISLLIGKKQLNTK